MTTQTKREELLALADRCEREEASRELDARIQMQAMGTRTIVWDSSDQPRIRGVDGTPLVPAYTTSLDAAVTLTDWCIAHLSEIGADGLPMCVLTNGTQDVQGMCLNSPTSGVTALARAVCAAALKARAALL